MSAGPKKEEKSNIAYPWQQGEDISGRIICPSCKNDGDDGSIHGRSTQYSIERHCQKCGHKWCGGIGVQRADFTEPPVIPGVESPPELEQPTTQFTGSPHRDPNKNYDTE